MDEFCRWSEGDYELCDESDDLPDDERLPVDDESLGAAWKRLSQQFERATGLRLDTYCRYRSDFDDDPDTGFEVVGAWERSPAGRKFFDIKGHKNEHAAGRDPGDVGEGT
jgi:heme-degrading monooxygenase HmoA